MRTPGTHEAWMISAFIFCYTIFQLPGGICGEKLGSRRTMTWIIVLWGVCAALTALLPVGSRAAKPCPFGASSRPDRFTRWRRRDP